MESIKSCQFWEMLPITKIYGPLNVYFAGSVGFSCFMGTFHRHYLYTVQTILYPHNPITKPTHHRHLSAVLHYIFCH